MENSDCSRSLITSLESNIQHRPGIAGTCLRIASLTVVSVLLLSIFVYVGSTQASGLFVSYRSWSRSSKPLAATRPIATRLSNRPVAAYQSLTQTPAGPCAQTNHENIQASAPHYLPGETVTATGRGFAPSCEVSMLVNLPDQSNGGGAATTDESGNLTYSYVLSAVTGDYSIQAVTSEGISLATAQFSSGIYVMTDKTDYKPGETVTFSGRGFAPNETISLVVHQNYPGGAPVRELSTVTDGTGAFRNSTFMVGEQDLNTTMRVVATGQSSGLTAEAMFADAAAVFVRKVTNQTTATTVTSINAAYGAGNPAAGNFLVAIISSFGGTTTITAPAGWSTAINQAGTATLPAQAIFYKISAGVADNSVTATFTPASTGTIIIQEFSNVLASSDPLDGTNSNSGNASANPSTGTLTPTSAATNDLLIAGLTAESATNTLTMAAGTVTNGFTTEAPIGTVNGGATGAQRVAAQSADKKTSAAGESTGFTITGTGVPATVLGWRGQIAAFKTKIDTTTAISVSPPSPSTFGQPVTFTATITPTSATGSVVIGDAGSNCVAFITAGQAQCTFTSLSVGSHSALKATYSGDDTYAPSVSPNLTPAYVVTANTANCFRSAASGDWNVPSNWQEAPPIAGACTSGALVWGTATSLPSSNAVGIQIRNGHTMTVTAAASAQALTVDSGGELDVNANQTLSLANGSGIDLTDNGTVSVSGTLTQAASSSVSVNGTFNITATGLVNGNGGSGATRPSFTANSGADVSILPGGSLATAGSGPSIFTFATGSTATVAGTITGNDLLTLDGTMNLSGSISMAAVSNLQSNGSVSLSGTATVSAQSASSSQIITLNSNAIWTLSGTAQININGNGDAKMQVLTGAILDLGPTARIGGTGDFGLEGGATLKIGDANGIRTGTATGATEGNVQNTGGIRSFATTANYEYKGTTAQVTGDAFPATVNNLTINNSAGVSQTAAATLIVNGTLALTSGDYNNGAQTLAQPNETASTGTGDVVGTVLRTFAFVTGTAYTYGNPNNNISFTAAGTKPTEVAVKLVKSAPTSPAKSNAVLRTYSITPTGGSGFSSTVTLHYVDSELNGNTDGTLTLWKVITGTWTDQGATSRNTTAGDSIASNNSVTLTGVTAFSDWTLASPLIVPTTTTVTSSSAGNTSTYGDSVTFTATVTPGVTSGNVTFTEGGTCAAPTTTLQAATAVNGSGEVTFTTSTLTIPGHTIRACYEGTTGFSPSEGNVTQTVNQKTLDITANDQSKTYGDTFTFTGSEFTSGAGQLVNGDSVTSVTLSSAGAIAMANVSGSPYSITPSAAVGSGLGNYAINYHEAPIGLTMNARGIRVAAESKTKEYGTSDPPLTFVVQGVGGGLVNGDTQATAFTGSLTRAPGESVAGSPYAITQGTLAPTSNYTLLNFNPAELTITKAGSTTTIDCSPGSFTYTGSAIEPCTATVTRVGDANTTTTVTYANNVNVGTATADASYAGDPNHTSSTATQVTFAITQANVTATAGGGTAVYNGSAKTPAPCVVSGAYAGDLTCENNPASVGPNAATYPINPVVSGTGQSNFNIALVPGSYTISKAPTTITPDSNVDGTNNDCVNVTYTATLKDVNNVGLSGINLKMTIGTQSTTAATDVNGLATFTLIVFQAPGTVPQKFELNQPWTDGNRFPPEYVSRDFTIVSDPIIGPGTDADSLYSGSLFFWTTGPSSSTATLNLSATIKDALDLCPTGDITRARVSFLISTNGGSSFSPVSNAQNLPVGLVNPNEPNVGAASAISEYNIGNDQSVTLTVRVVVGGYYNFSASTYDQLITIGKPGSVNSLTGGGKLKNDGVPYPASGYLGVNSISSSFGSQVTYTKSGTNPKGQVTIAIRSCNRVDGTADPNCNPLVPSTHHVYWIKTNSISELSRINGSASFGGKTNGYEQFADGSKINFDSGNSLQLLFTPQGKAMPLGTYASTYGGAGNPRTCNNAGGCASVVLFRSAGGVWYSSSWGAPSNSTTPRTVLKNVLYGTVNVN